MAFATDVREEIARLPLTEFCCAKSELSAVFRANGVAFVWPNRYELSVTSSEGAVVRRYFAMLKQFWGIPAQIRVVETSTFGGQSHYRLLIPDEYAVPLLKDCGLWDENELFSLRKIPREEITRFDCCKKAFVRGAFLTGGTANTPNKESQWEINVPSEEYARFLIDLMNNFGIIAKFACRKYKFAVYLKQTDAVADALTLLGATRSVMTFEEIHVRRTVRNQVNRVMNCDAANINRVVNGSKRQCADIEFIDEVMGLDKLPESLRQMAVIRLNNPDISLTELGDLFEQPITKNAVNARLRRLSELAKQLREGETIKEDSK